MSQRRLEGRAALVTGSSRGIGAAIAARLGADGAKVAVHANASRNAAEALARSIRDEGGEAVVLMGDLTEGDTARRLVRETIEAFGAIDILVNNAAVSNQCPLADQDDDGIDRDLALNLRPVLLATAEFAKRTRSCRGRVINISSAAGKHPAYLRSIYSASKGAMEAYTRTIALELGERGITANAVAPGTTSTDLFAENEAKDPRDWRTLFSRWTALGRIGEPGDIADIVAFVASDDARWLTGNVLSADGGLVTTGTNVAAFASNR